MMTTTLSTVLAAFPLADVDPTGYVIVAWVITFGSVIAYGAYTMRKGKKLAQQLPPEDRRLIK